MNTYIKYLSKYKSTEQFKPYVALDPNKFTAIDKVPLKKKDKHENKGERKLNVKVKRHDIYLLDAVADRLGLSRSALISTLLYSSLLDELMAIEDKDARALLAKLADDRANQDYTTRPWVHDLFESDFEYVLNNIIRGNSIMERNPCPTPGFVSTEGETEYNSITFISILKKLKGLKNE